MSGNNFKIYAASAGSGKTWILVKEYLRLILSKSNPSYYKNILAVTFTNKAAGEMKMRVFDALKGLSYHPDAGKSDLNLLERLQDELGVDEATIRQRSKVCFDHMLHHYSEVSISTIDSFQHRLIRSFANEMHLAPDFDIEIDSRKVQEAAIDQVLEHLGDGSDLSKYLMAFLKQRLEEEKGWNLRQEIVKFSRPIFSEKIEAILEKLSHFTLDDFNKVAGELRAVNNKFEKGFFDLAQSGLNEIDSRGVDHTLFSSGYVPKYFQKVISGKIEMPSATVIKMVNGEQDWCKKSLPEQDKDLVYSIQPGLSDILNEMLNMLESEAHRMYKTRIQILKFLNSLALFANIHSEAEKWKLEHNTLVIEDFKTLIHKMLLNNSAPFIYERIGEKYRHFLIDEFQDTSIVQWHNFLPLIENSLAGGHMSLVVGDGKQSIYRFRNGEVEQLINLPKIFAKPDSRFDQLEASLMRESVKINLEYNYRSLPEIITFNNRLYDHLAPSAREFEKVYDNHHQKPKRSGSGYVFCRKIVKIDKETDQAAFVEFVQQSIQKALTCGYSMGDITILVRKAKDARFVGEGLGKMGFSVRLEDSFQVGNSPWVRWLMNVLLWFYHPNETVFAVEALRAFSQIEKGADIHELLTHSIDGQRADLTGITTFKSKDDMSQSFEGKSIFEQALELLENSLIAPPVSDAYLEKLLEELVAFSLKDDGVGAFKLWWENELSKKNISTGGTGDSIRIMTIHKAKGLQFPVVILPLPYSSDLPQIVEIPDGDPEVNLPSALISVRPSGMLDMADPIPREFDKTRLDIVNLIYVATSRAEDQLYIAVQTNTRLQPETTSHMPEILFSGIQSAFKWSGDDDLELGMMVSQTREKKEYTAHQIQFRASGLQSKVNVAYKAQKIWDAMSPQGEKEKGLKLHELLARIQLEDDVDTALKSMLNESLITSTEMTDMKTKVSEIVSSSKTNHWFKLPSRVRNEVELLSESGGILRPDRVMWFDDHVAVLDYKTGAVKDKHLKQVRKYVDAIAEVENLPVKGSILYTNALEIVEV